MADELDRWLAVAENRGEWERLRLALQLESGFALFVVDVPDVGTEGRVVELLAGERAELVVLDARSSGEQAPVRELMRTRQSVVALRSVEASRWDVEALERCLVQLNARRDRLAVRGHVLVIVLRRDEVARMIDVAPDLYSVHRARFRFARLVKPRPMPLWLLSDQEFAALLDDDGRPFDERLDRYRMRHDLDLLDDFDAWASARPGVSESIAARTFARHEGLRCLVPVPAGDLASALASPSIAVADVLRTALETAGSHHLAYLCAAALTWMHLQGSDLLEARVTLEEALRHARGCDRGLGLRSGCLALHVAAADAMRSRWGVRFTDHLTYANLSAYLGHAAARWELGIRHMPHSLFRSVIKTLEAREWNRWRFDPELRSVSSDQIQAEIPEGQRDEARAWLRERRLAKDRNWAPTWTTYLMIERALHNAANVAEFVTLGREWLDTPAHHRSYEVWHPLVDIHADARDSASLDDLIRMPLALDAAERFGPKLPAALHVVADVLDRGLVELSTTERDALRARAAARTDLPLDMRLGWWAIELALADDDRSAPIQPRSLDQNQS